MPTLTGLARVVRLATLPETRSLIVAAAQSDALRDVARRAVNDRAALVRDLRNPANARDFVRNIDPPTDVLDASAFGASGTAVDRHDDLIVRGPPSVTPGEAAVVATNASVTPR